MACRRKGIGHYLVVIPCRGRLARDYGGNKLCYGRYGLVLQLLDDFIHDNYGYLWRPVFFDSGAFGTKGTFRR